MLELLSIFVAIALAMLLNSVLNCAPNMSLAGFPEARPSFEPKFVDTV
jgi:hypothetical protein